MTRLEVIVPIDSSRPAPLRYVPLISRTAHTAHVGQDVHAVCKYYEYYSLRIADQLLPLDLRSSSQWLNADKGEKCI